MKVIFIIILECALTNDLSTTMEVTIYARAGDEDALCGGLLIVIYQCDALHDKTNRVWKDENCF